VLHNVRRICRSHRQECLCHKNLERLPPDQVAFVFLEDIQE
jgi:hypothetical protein